MHRSDSPILTFGKLEFSLIKHGVASTCLQQPNVGLFPIRAGGPSRLLQWRQVQLTHRHTQRNRSTLPAVPYLLWLPSPPLPIRTPLKDRTPIVFDHTFTNWPLHIATPPTVNFVLVASRKVCITEHLNSVVQLGPRVSAGHSRVFDCVSCNSLEGSEVRCTW